MTKPLRVALLDLNNNTPNRGFGYLRRLVESYGDAFVYDTFDVRHKFEIPDTSYDIYLSSGGPGSPFDFEGGWDKPYFSLLEQLWQHNNTLSLQTVSKPKFVFFICHSFQLACQHFNVGDIKRRVARSFGTFPCYKSENGAQESYFEPLPDPFWIADFRDWQVVNVDMEDFTQRGFKILALEKKRPRIKLPRAVMAIRFSETWIGTQFHPEADADGMYEHFNDPARREQVVRDYGQEKYDQMLEDLKDDRKIDLTHKTILPRFLFHALSTLEEKT
jgi:homoserine O-succinyltransferase/O-acetyltransferase